MHLKSTVALAILFAPLTLAAAKDDYKLGLDSMKQSGVPEGKVS